jgi:hypothetical protein
MGPRAGLDAVEKKNLALPAIETGSSNSAPAGMQIELSRLLRMILTASNLNYDGTEK